MAHDKALLQDHGSLSQSVLEWSGFGAMNTGLSKDAGMFKPAAARTSFLRLKNSKLRL